MRLPGTEPPVQQLKPEATEPTTKAAFSFNPIEMVLLLFKLWWVILIAVIVCTAIAVVYAINAPDVYRAAARIEVFQENRLRGSRGLNEYDKLESQAMRHIIIMSGNLFHRDLISKLRPKWKDVLDKNEMKVPVRITPVGRSTSMIDLYVDSSNPKYAVDYLQGILGSYSEQRQREFKQINQNAVAGLRDEEERISKKLIQIQTSIEQFEFENNLLIAKERQAMQAELVNDLLNRLQSIQIERSILENQYEEIVHADLETIRTALEQQPNSHIREFLLDYGNDMQVMLPQQPSQMFPGGLAAVDPDSTLSFTGLSWEQQEDLMASLQNEYNERLDTFHTTHPKMEELQSQINAVNVSLDKKLEISVRRFQARYQALKRKEESIEKVIKNIENKRNLTADRQNEYILLKSQEAQLNSKYDLVYQQILENAGSIDSLQVIIINEPYIWDTPIAPDKMKLYLIGPFVGLFLSIGFIVFKCFLLPALINIFKQHQQNQQTVVSSQEPVVSS